MSNCLDPQPRLPHFLDLWQQTLGWQPNDQQQERFQHLYELILSGNQHLNLTRITAPEDFWEKHLWDSLRGVGSAVSIATGLSSVITTPSPFMSSFKAAKTAECQLRDAQQQPNENSQLRVVDVGTGAGFPGIPVAIVHPQWHVTLVDSTRKKIAFVEGVITALGLNNTEALSERAEHLATQPTHRNRYDVVLVRAVASADRCVEYALPLLRSGGVAVLYRGQWQPSDTEALQPMIHHLGAHLAFIDLFTTPLTQSQRCCLYVQKLPTSHKV